MSRHRIAADTSRRDVARAAVLVAHGIIRRERACEGKRVHMTLNDARCAAKAVTDRTGRPAHPYRCEFCDRYHVTKLRHGEYSE